MTQSETDGPTLAGKVAIVTGSSRGLGRRIAELIGSAGASVVVNYAADDEAGAAAETVADIVASGGHAVAVQADVSSVAQIELLFAAAERHFGGVDIVVSNAGAAAAIKPLVGVTEAEYDAATAINAKANFFVLREAARKLRDGGRIVVITSTTVVTPFAGTAIYAGAKAASEVYARVLARELGGRGITVNAIAPGPIDTTTSRAAGSTETRFAAAINMTPLGRLGTVDDIAQVAAFIVSERARWITGQHLRIGGGVI